MTESTLGDMVFIVHCHRAMPYTKSKSSCIDHMLSIIGSYGFYGGKVFDAWLDVTKDFDFTPYI